MEISWRDFYTRNGNLKQEEVAVVVLVVEVKTIADMENKKDGKGSKKRWNGSSTSDME